MFCSPVKSIIDKTSSSLIILYISLIKSRLYISNSWFVDILLAEVLSCFYNRKAPDADLQGLVISYFYNKLRSHLFTYLWNERLAILKISHEQEGSATICSFAKVKTMGVIFLILSYHLKMFWQT
jgi:hypothetical protein